MEILRSEDYINEKLNIQPVSKERMSEIVDGTYAITGCTVEWEDDQDYMSEHKNGLSGSKKYPIRMKADSLEQLLIGFAKKVAPNHTLDFVNDWEESDLKDYTLMLFLKGHLNKETFEFTDPTSEEWDEFLDGKRTMTCVYYCVGITKGGKRADLSDEMSELYEKYNEMKRNKK